VYAQTEQTLNDEYRKLQLDTTALKYSNFVSHTKMYWGRKTEWAVCFRDNATLRGIDTNNYAESGI
jgi:hypothetical protein